MCSHPWFCGKQPLKRRHRTFVDNVSHSLLLYAEASFKIPHLKIFTGRNDFTSFCAVFYFFVERPEFKFQKDHQTFTICDAGGATVVRPVLLPLIHSDIQSSRTWLLIVPRVIWRLPRWMRSAHALDPIADLCFWICAFADSCKSSLLLTRCILTKQAWTILCSHFLHRRSGFIKGPRMTKRCSVSGAVTIEIRVRRIICPWCLHFINKE